MKKALQLSVLALLAAALTSGVALVHHLNPVPKRVAKCCGLPPPPQVPEPGAVAVRK